MLCVRFIFHCQFCQPESQTKHVSANIVCPTKISLSTKQVTKLICLPDKTKVQHFICQTNPKNTAKHKSLYEQQNLSLMSDLSTSTFCQRVNICKPMSSNRKPK